MLKFPKNVSPEFEPLLLTYFSQNTRPLRQEVVGARKVSIVAFDELLGKMLRSAAQAGHLIQGLEKIGSSLDREKRGIDLAQKSDTTSINKRMSRLLLLSNDGTSRFYRDAEAIIERHESRVWGCIIDTDSQSLGNLYGAKGKPVKALLIDDRKTLGNCLNLLAKEM